MKKITQIIIVSSALLLVSCGGGGKRGGGSNSSTVSQSSLGETDLVRVLGSKELWLPRDIMLEAKLIMGPKMVDGLKNMDRYFNINCSQVHCLVIKKGN